jgi:hypothetical protein
MKSKLLGIIVSIFALGLLLTLLSGSYNETVIFIGTNGKITTADQAIYKYQTSASKKSTTVYTYLKIKDDWKKINAEQYKIRNDSTYEIKANGEGVPESILRTYKKQPEGPWLFRENVKGNIIRTGHTKSLIPLLLHGEVTEYYINENIKSKSIYRNNELVSNENWLPDGNKYIDNIFYSVDSVAIFIPGDKVLHQHVLEAIKEAKIDLNKTAGSIVVGFVVMENGTIDGIRILKGLDQKINKVIYQSIYTLPLKGNWIPAQLNGKTVRYFQVFPVNFKAEYNQLIYSKILHDYMEWDRKW